MLSNIGERMTDTEKQRFNIEQQIGIRPTTIDKKSMKSSYRYLWKLGLLFGVISLILSLMIPLLFLNNLISRPYPLDIPFNPTMLLAYSSYFAPLFISLGVIFVSFAGLKSLGKKIDSEAT